MTSLDFLLATTLMYSTPLIFTALGGLLSEKTGIINIGLEGMMTFGAFCASAAALATQNPWLGLLAGGCGGLALGLIHGWACLKFQANQVISGIAINFLGLGLAIFLCRIFFDGAGMTPPLDLDKKMPVVAGQYITVYLSFLFSFFIWYIFRCTVFGLRLISIGEHPQAAEAAGIRISFYRWLAVLASGFLAGLGGASLSIAIVSNFRPTLISGQGFISIAAIIFGGWRPFQTTLACLFFGLSQALVVYIGGMENLKVSSQLLSTLPYIITLFILITYTGKSSAPSGLGK